MRTPVTKRDGLAGAALFVASFAFTLYQNSRVAVLWDLSYLLDSAFRFSLGQLPYRDLPFAHAPLTFLLHAGLLRVFGRVYYPHILCAALESGAATALTWRILLRLLAPLGAGAWRLALMLASPLCVVGIYGIYPHPIYDSDSILSVLLSLWLLLRAASGPAANVTAGVACVLPLFFKQNIGLVYLLAVLGATMTVAAARMRQRQSAARQFWIIGGAAAGLLAALAALQSTVGLSHYVYWTISFARQRRLPGSGALLAIYHQTSLLWSLPAAAAGVVLLRASRLRGRWLSRPLAALLLTAPFLWTLAGMALTDDPADRADQMLALWPHLLILAAAVAGCSLLRRPTLLTLLPLAVLATIHGTFLAQQLWGSTYAIWPLLVILIVLLLLEVPAVALPAGTVAAFVLAVCGGFYALSLDRVSYIHLEGTRAQATLPELRGMASPGPWLPAFEELVRVTNTEIPADDGILLVPGEVPFYFATGRTPQFPILLFDPATDPYTPQQTLDEAVLHNIRWLIVTRNLQLMAAPKADLPEIVRVLQTSFVPYRQLGNYDIYRRP